MELREIEHWVEAMQQDDERLEWLIYVTTRNVSAISRGQPERLRLVDEFRREAARRREAGDAATAEVIERLIARVV